MVIKSQNNKKPSGDAFFVSKYGIGVADGVGGWGAYGIDPSKFSEDLMNESKLILQKKEDQINQNKPKEIFFTNNHLEEGYESEDHT